MRKVNKIPVLAINGHSGYETPTKLRVLFNITASTYVVSCLFYKGHFLSFLKKFYWSIVDIQCCVNLQGLFFISDTWPGVPPWSESHHGITFAGVLLLPLLSGSMYCLTALIISDMMPIIYELSQWLWYIQICLISIKFFCPIFSSWIFFLFPLKTDSHKCWESYLMHLCEHSLKGKIRHCLKKKKKCLRSYSGGSRVNKPS